MPDNKMLSKLLREEVFLPLYLLNKLCEGLPLKAGFEGSN